MIMCRLVINEYKFVLVLLERCQCSWQGVVVMIDDTECMLEGGTEYLISVSYTPSCMVP